MRRLEKVHSKKLDGKSSTTLYNKNPNSDTPDCWIVTHGKDGISTEASSIVELIVGITEYLNDTRIAKITWCNLWENSQNRATET